MCKKIKWLCLLLLLISLSHSRAFAAGTNVPYDTYNYDYWNDVYDTPAAYLPDKSISGTNLGAGSFHNPQDIFVAEDGKLYIADTGNNRIVILDKNGTLYKILDRFDNGGKEDSFLNPYGIHVTKENDLYIADSEHNRVVALKEDGTLYRILHNPTSEVLPKDFIFTPMKVTVDYAGRVYVIAKNMFQGILSFDEKGNFTGFAGTIHVNITPYEKLWRRLSTKSQRSRQAQFIPTEFTGVDISPDGFIYASNIDAKGSQSVRRLNPKGQDVIKKNNRGNKGSKLSGDLRWRLGGDYSGASRIVDVVYRGSGIYSILDVTRGRIFTYDQEGNLLYVFGGRGSQEGTFKNPAAIEVSGEELLVLDSYRGEVLTFVNTEYGRLINEAIALRYDGNEAAAVALWKKVLKLDSNFELAYVGIGKAYLSSGENKKAMKYFKLGMDREYYSIAFKRYRDDFLKAHLKGVLTVITIGIAICLFRRRIKRFHGKKGVWEDDK